MPSPILTRHAMSTKLTAEQIPALSDGLVGRLIDQALKAAAHDLDERGDDGDPRKVTIEVIMEKEPHTTNCTIKADVKVTTPKFKSPKTQGVVTAVQGQSILAFETDSPVPVETE